MFEDVDRIDQDQLGRQIAIRNRVRTFDARDPPDYSSLEERVRGAIANHFQSKLERPELLNRIGEENIIVFDFIRPRVARDICKKQIESVTTRVRETNNVELLLPSHLEDQLLARCTRDLKDGGRGIGNNVETNFINPLARALFELNAPAGARVTVDQIDFDQPGYSVKLSCKSV
jgi:ATP-dependent Clp protease ATP-binding subunit ClpA